MKEALEDRGRRERLLKFMKPGGLGGFLMILVGI